MKEKQKRFIFIIISVLILICLAAISYFVWRKNNLTSVDTQEIKSPLPQSLTSPPPTPTPTPTLTVKDGTANWKTYTSQKYNFEFRYPPEARLSDQSEGYVAVSFMGEKQKASGRTQTELFDGYAFNIADVTAGGYGDLDDFYAQKVIQLKEVCTEIGNPRETTISGSRAITQKLSCMGDYDAYYVLRNNQYFEISLLHVGDEEDLPGYIETVNQIFSTFKFNN